MFRLTLQRPDQARAFHQTEGNRMTRILLTFWMLLIMAGQSLAQENPLADRLKAFIAAYNNADSAAIAEFYTEEGALIPPRSQIIVGRKAIAEHYARAFQSGVGQLKINILEIRGHGGDTLVEISDMTVNLNGNLIGGRYLHVWVKQNDNWYLSRDMYHLR